MLCHLSIQSSPHWIDHDLQANNYTLCLLIDFVKIPVKKKKRQLNETYRPYLTQPCVCVY